MQSSNLQAHLFFLHVTENPTCHCSNNIEDSQHYFFECPLYFTQRLTLSTTLTALGKFDLNTILFLDPDQDEMTNKIILTAVHKYIKESGRFDWAVKLITLIYILLVDDCTLLSYIYCLYLLVAECILYILCIYIFDFYTDILHVSCMYPLYISLVFLNVWTVNNSYMNTLISVNTCW